MPYVGDTCRRGIIRYRDSGEFYSLPREADAGNGACMRNLPVVLATLNQPDYFQAWTKEQCHLTHHNPLADAGTLALGRMVNYLIHSLGMEACRHEADKLIADFADFAYIPYPGKTTGYIVDTLQTVLHHFFHTDSFESCLIATVNQGGDADTNGALAGMLAGAKYGVEQIPARWLAALDTATSERIGQQTAALLRLATEKLKRITIQ